MQEDFNLIMEFIKDCTTPREIRASKILIAHFLSEYKSNSGCMDLHMELNREYIRKVEELKPLLAEQ